MASIQSSQKRPVCGLLSYRSWNKLQSMTTSISSKGQLVVPKPLREAARLDDGDELDAGYVNGLLIFRKRTPLTAAQANALILSGRDLPEMTAADADEVADALKTVRRRRRQA